MSFGRNLQHLRKFRNGLTQEALAERLRVSRQTVSKWEMDAAQPEIDKAIELCRFFNCTLDNLFRDELDSCDSAYSELRVEEVPAFRYVKYAVISADPEGDALGRIRKLAGENGFDAPRIIGWDFPQLSAEQINVYGMHGYEAAWILPEGFTPEGMEVYEQATHRYAAIHIRSPFDAPFSTIPNAYKTLLAYMKTNGLACCEKGVIPCFETDGQTMDVYIACE